MTLEELEIVITTNIDGVTEQLEQAKSNIEQAFDSEKVTQLGNNVAQSSTEIAKFATQAVGGANATKALSLATTQFGIALKTALPIILAVSLAITAIVATANKIQQDIDNIKKAIAEIGKAIVNVITPAIKYLYNELRNLTSKGINNLVQESATLNKSISELQGASIQLGNAIASAVAPVIEALTPIIISVINVLIDLMNVIAQINASLFGNATTYQKATKVTTNYAKAVGGASKQQQKMLAGFDELNVLAEKTSKGGGGLGTAIQDMFETAPIEKALLDTSNWANIGEELANKLNNALDNWDAEAVGLKISNFINSSLDFAVGFLKKTKWTQLGSKIATFLNNALKIDPKKIGATISGVLNSAFQTVYGFASTFNWKEFGENLMTSLIETIKNINTDDLANAINTVVLGILDFVLALIDTWNNNEGSRELNTKVQELMDKIKWDEILPKLVRAIIQGWWTIESVKAELKWTILKEAVGWVTGGFKDKVVGAYNTVREKVEEVWTGFTTWFGQHMENSGLAEVARNVGDGIKNGLTWFWDGIVKTFKTEINQIIDFLNQLNFELPDYLGGGKIGFHDIPHVGESGKATYKNITAGTASSLKSALNQGVMPNITSKATQTSETSLALLNSIDNATNKITESVKNIKSVSSVTGNSIAQIVAGENYRVGGKLYGV